MASPLQAKGVLAADHAAGGSRSEPAAALAGARGRWAALWAALAVRFHKWREDRQTWDALQHLDDRQLKEFGIHSRPAGLGRRELS